MKTRYALKALVQLAQEGPEATLGVADLSERESIPRKFLEAIFRELKQHGLLTSQRGRGGGYTLRRPPGEISLASIVRALDGPIAPVPCLSKTAYRRCDECRSEQACGVRLVLKDLYDATAKILEGTTVADLVERARRAQAPVALRFAI